MVESELLLMAVTIVRLLTLLPGDAGTCRVIAFNFDNLLDLQKYLKTLISRMKYVTFYVSNYHFIY